MNKRDMILSAAFELILQKGIVSTKIIDIAERAGIGKGTVYDYFKSKDEILLTIFDAYILNEYELMDKGLAEKKNTEERLLFFLEFKEDMLRRYGPIISEIPNLMGTQAGSALSDEIRFAALSMIAREMKSLKRIVELGKAAGELKDEDSEHFASYIFSATASHVAAHANEGKGFVQGDNELLCELETIYSPCENSEFIKLVLKGIAA